MLPTPQRLLPLLLLALHHPLSTVAQQLIPSNLPTCAASCAQLQNAQTGCTPAGGAPVSNQQTYQSCFCQSALLTALYQQPGAQLCTQCSASDNQAIQSWYQGFCKAGASALQSTGGANSASQPASTGAPQATNTISQVQNNPAQTSGATVVGNSQGVTNDDTNNGPWFSTHWKWIVMLVVLIIGLTAFAVIFSVLHKRYHRRREAQWSQSTVAHPDINTWGPGQSVHDFGVYRAAGNLKRSLSRSLSRTKRNQPNSSSAEKGKAASGVAEVHPMPPMPAYKPERGGTGFGARQPPPPVRNGRFSRGGGGAMF